MSSKVNRLVNTVLKTVNLDSVQVVIGDSTNNNRVPSVRQVIRYLNQTNQFTLGSDLGRVYRSLLSKKVFKRLRRGTYRTDAIDINELVQVLSLGTIVDAATKRELGNRIYWTKL